MMMKKMMKKMMMMMKKMMILMMVLNHVQDQLAEKDRALGAAIALSELNSNALQTELTTKSKVVQELRDKIESMEIDHGRSVGARDAELRSTKVGLKHAYPCLHCHSLSCSVWASTASPLRPD
jgi:hypothetical protein